jgi:RHS repeat-associated protein
LPDSGDHVQILHLGLFEVVDDITKDKVTYRHTIEADGAAVAEIVEQADGTTSTEYYVHDHLGSVTVTLDATGKVLGRARHGAWGEPQDPKTGIQLASTETDGLAHQGYTGHVDLTSLGLIHMGGRIYSIPLHRFLSADPNVQFPLSSQGYNRYAYVNNNPLSETDPTGYYSMLGFTLAGGWGAEHPQEAGQGLTIVGPIVGAAVDAYVPACATLCGKVITIASEAVAGYMMTNSVWGGVKMGLLAYAGSEAFGTLGDHFSKLSGAAALAGKTVSEGFVGGLLSEAGGGRFSDGFLGSAAGALTEGPLSNLGRGPTQMIAAAMIGGSVSYIGGGSFANGAVTAAFANMFGNSGGSSDGIGGDGAPAWRFTRDKNGNLVYYDGLYGGPFSDCDECLHVSDPYGAPRDGGTTLHGGIDLATGGRTGIEALSLTSGTVVQIGAKGFGPNSVTVRAPDGVYLTYGHLASHDVNLGEKVSGGMPIGEIGTMGNSTGIHLHIQASTNSPWPPNSRMLGISCSGSAIHGC